ncbi:MAG: dihydropteroate synthase [Deltaproteobacteria bacterium]|nr:MAG: dihydropteroate synthase [Deltaproteobacteria bacterium]
MEHPDLKLELRNHNLSLGERTHIMGILNVTPDSFSDGGQYLDSRKAVRRAREMADEGADIIDVGGESSRPGSAPVGLDEELKRVMPVIEEVAKKTNIPISIDTYKSEVARRALDGGAEIVNDISALNFDTRMADLIAQRKVPVILMHMRGTPKDMQNDLHYDSLIPEILTYLSQSIDRAETTGVNPRKIVIDPGIGFGKSAEDNLRIIRNLSEFKILVKPILLGTSRKSFIGKILNNEEGDRLEGSIASVVAGIINGANIVRVHDVKETKKAVLITDAIKSADG